MTGTIRDIIDDTATIGAELEQKRESFFRIFLMLAPMSFAAICAIAALNTDQGTFAWPAVLVFTLMAVVIEFQIFNTLYRKRTKAALLDRIASSLGLRHDPRGVFPLQDMAPHKIIPPHDISHVEDGFTGNIHGVPIAFQEIHLANHRRDERNRILEEHVFRGLAIRIGIGKILNAHTVILPRNAMLSFFRRLFSEFEPVNLVSPAFESRFDVLSTDQVEARYILDPAFMERLLAAAESLGTKYLEVSFLGQEIAITVQHNGPLFETGSLWTRLTADHLQELVDELEILTGLIDILKLNPYTGLGAALPRRDES